MKGVERATGVAAAAAKDPDIAVKFVKDKTSAAKNAVADLVENSDQYVARAKEAVVGGASALVDGAKNPKKTMQTVREAGHGFHRGLADSAKGASGHLLVGGEDFRELNARIYFQCEEYKSLGSPPPGPGQVTDGSSFLDAVLAGGDAARVALEGEIPEEVLQAYSLQYPNVMESFKEKINRFSEEQVRGLVAGVRGKLFEIQYLDHLNGGVFARVIPRDAGGKRDSICCGISRVWSCSKGWLASPGTLWRSGRSCPVARQSYTTGMRLCRNGITNHALMRATSGDRVWSRVSRDV